MPFRGSTAFDASFAISSSALAEQERVFARAFTVLDEAIAEHAFPGATVAVTLHGGLIAHRGFGTLTYDTNMGQASSDVTVETVYDVASLTKVVATTATAMILLERGALDLDMPLVRVVPEFATAAGAAEADARRKDVYLRMLLAHSSGLAAHERFYLTGSTPDEMWQAIFSAPLQAAPGSRTEYSDIGFMLLGLALERIAEETLDVFCRREVFAPLGMRQTAFRGVGDAGASAQRFANPAANIAPTAWMAAGLATSGLAPEQRDAAEKRGAEKYGSVAESAAASTMLQGVVNDGNAHALGGVAGHAGVFSSALDVARFAECMLRGGAPLVHARTVAQFTQRQSSPVGTSRALGWDTPSAPSQSGKYFSARSFGHLGYTGTSLWIDPERDCSVTLLTNRTMPLHPGVPRKRVEFDAIKRVRPRFHDAVMEALDAIEAMAAPTE